MNKCFIFLLLLLTPPLFSKNLAIILNKKLRGDYEFANRVVKAAANIGWQTQIIDPSEHIPTTHNFDISITLPDIYTWIPKGSINYFVLFENFRMFNYGIPGNFNNALFSYDGYLLTISDKKYLQKQLEKKGLPFHYVDWLPLVHRNAYREVTPKYLAYLYCDWGNRGTEKYNYIITHLEKKGYLHVYGHLGAKNVVSTSYQGSIPFDGQSLLDTLHKDGISLVIHSSNHNQEGIPSGRIFESAAASAVIICDSNPFVMKHFGDSVLYFDHTQDKRSIVRQINQQMKWIQENPTQAKEMAKKAHAIFLENYLLENQLLRLNDMNEKILSARRNV